MKKFTMDKVVTLIESEEKTMKVSVHTYKELKALCENEDAIEVKYALGLMNRRRKQLKEIGFTLQEELHFAATEKHHQVHEVWVKEKTFPTQINSEGNKVLIIREVGTSAIIERDTLRINQMQWDSKDDFDYNSIQLTKQEILGLAAHIQNEILKPAIK